MTCSLDRTRIPATRSLLLGLLLGLAAPASARADGFVVPFAGVNFAGNSGQELSNAIDARRFDAGVRPYALAGLGPAAAPAQTPSPVRTVPSVDLARYAGDWFEIARFPNWFQRQCVGDVRASYTRRPDGRLDVVNRCRSADGDTEARGIARIVDERSFAKLKVRFAPAWLSFLPVVWGDYWIIGLAPDYSWAVVGDPGRNYLWILARSPHLDDRSVAAARLAARQNGYDVERLVPTPQTGERRP